MAERKGETSRENIELERELDDKQSLELDIERLRGALQVMKNMEDDNDVDLKQKMKEIEEILEAKEELSRVLTVKHWRNNDELQDACKELIKEIIDEEDEKLKALKDEYGEDVFKAVSRPSKR
ncbi:hypothetical protein ACJRO7_011618 [Eucalyptus globulus]|uniref:Factor of DNA methylation 1-5/IDN2 domain-containing protein n=1 Tax=Eucalyptus globulus TaxID=34317 RepID=A0ABD3LGX3_EUCGL